MCLKSEAHIFRSSKISSGTDYRSDTVPTFPQHSSTNSCVSLSLSQTMFQRKSSASLPTTMSPMTLPTGNDYNKDGSGKAIKMDAPVVKAWKQASNSTKYSYYVLGLCIFMIFMGIRYLSYWNGASPPKRYPKPRRCTGLFTDLNSLLVLPRRLPVIWMILLSCLPLFLTQFPLSFKLGEMQSLYLAHLSRF